MDTAAALAAMTTRTVSGTKRPRARRVRLITFEVIPDQAGGFHARGAGVALVTRGDTMEDVRANAREAVARHYFDAPGEYAVGMIFRLSPGQTERAIDYLRVG